MSPLSLQHNHRDMSNTAEKSKAVTIGCEFRGTVTSVKTTSVKNHYVVSFNGFSCAGINLDQSVATLLTLPDTVIGGSIRVGQSIVGRTRPLTHTFSNQRDLDLATSMEYSWLADENGQSLMISVSGLN